MSCGARGSRWRLKCLEHFSEDEATLLYISDARERADRPARSLGKMGAETHLVVALRSSEAALADLHRKLMQQTYFAVPVDS